MHRPIYIFVNVAVLSLSFSVSCLVLSHIPRIYLNYSHYSHTPIDIVITWVNGSDRAWQRKFLSAKQIDDGVAPSPKQFADRFISRDELRYVLRSIETNLPWFNKIFLITANQKPYWLNPNNTNIEIISHDQLFDESIPIPSFNSVSIEFGIKNIPGLSERFIYINDDMFINNFLPPSYFFLADGRTRYPIHLDRVWKNPQAYLRKYSNDSDNNDLQMYYSQQYGTAAIFQAKFKKQQIGGHIHCPAPLTTTILNELYHIFPKQINDTIKTRFRRPSNLQFGLAAYLYGIETNQTIGFDPLKTHIYFAINNPKSLRLFQNIPPTVDTFCLNFACRKCWGIVYQVLTTKWPNRSQFELAGQ